jgi:exopolyphosphatase/guanosine-5'-triphosphate,3'-diphosphate pyrophosphatase
VTDSHNSRTGGASSYCAAIDIGTNSMHLVVARLGEHGGFEMLTSEKEMVRLGQGGGEMKQLAPEAIDRGIAALSRMAKVAESFGRVELVAVATSAVREATNRDDFIDRAKNEVGIEVEVISGFEEARLIHLGVLQALPVFDQRLLVIDIGGGSTEFLVGEGAQAIEARSMKLGAIRLTERFFPDLVNGDGEVDPAAVEACHNYVRAALSPVAHELGGHQPEIAIASSGTATTIAAMAAAARGDNVKHMNGVVFTADELSAVVADVVSKNTAERNKIDGLDAKRVDIIVAGSILLDEIRAAFSLSEFTISEFALREGVLFDRFGAEGERQLEDLRRSNLLRLARQLDPDPDHAEHTADLALQLFDRTEQLHGLGREARELLEAAALVHNVGLFISHSSHHKHSYYVIRNSEQLTGFTEREIELIAVIARYHRKSNPTEKHSEFADLSKDDKQRVRVLAGMLRVAIGLDRRHAASVQSLRVFMTEGRLEIEPIALGGADLDVEIYAARERSQLLASAFGVDVVVEPPRPHDPDLISS